MIIVEIGWFWLTDFLWDWMWYLKNIISTPWGFDYTIKFIIALSDLFDEWDEDRYYVFWWYEIPLTKNNIYYEFRVIKNYLETYDVNIMFLLTFWATMSYCFPNYLAMQATKIFLIYFYFIVNIFLVLFSFKKWVIYAYSIGIFNEIQLFLIILAIFLFLHFPGSIRFILLIGFLGILYVLAWVIFFYHLFWLYTFFWNYDIELAVYLSPYIWFYIWIFLYFSSLRIFHNTVDYYNNLPDFNLNAIIDLFFFIPKKSIIIFLNHYKGLSYLETTFFNKLIMFYRKLLFSWLLKRFFFSNLTELLKNITPEHFNYLYLPHKSWFLLFLKDIRNLVLQLYEFSITNIYISFRGSMGSAWWWTFYYNFFWWMDCPLAFWWSGIAIFIQKLGLKIYIFFLLFYKYVSKPLNNFFSKIKLPKLEFKVNFFFRKSIFSQSFITLPTYFSQIKFLNYNFFFITNLFIFLIYLFLFIYFLNFFIPAFLIF